MVIAQEKASKILTDYFARLIKTKENLEYEIRENEKKIKEIDDELNLFY